MHTENFRSSAAPPIVKDGIPNSHRRLSFQRCSTNCQGQVFQFTPKTFVPALLHQLSRTGISNSHRRLSFQRCSTNCQGQVLQFTPKTFVPALLHQLSRTGSPIHTEDFRSSAAPPTVKDMNSNSHRRLSLQRCSTNCQGQVPIHTEDFRSSAAPPTVKDKFSNSHRRLSHQRCSTNCQGQVLQFTPKTFAPALLHQLSRTGSPIHTEDFRSDQRCSTNCQGQVSNSHRRLSLQRCSTNCQGQVLQFTPKTFNPALSTNCQGQVLQFTPKTFAPALLHQLSRTGILQFTPKTFVPALLHQLSRTGISNSHRRLSFQRCSTNLSRTGISNSHRRLSFQRCSTNCQGQGFSNSHRRLSFQRCSTNCQGQDLQFTPKTFVPALLHHCQGQVLQFTPKTFVPALLHQLSRTGSPIHTEDFRSSAAPPTVKDRFSNSHRRLSFQRCSTTVKDRFSNSHRRLSLQRCSTNCQGQVLQFTPKTFVPALLHQLSRTGSPIHTKDFRSSAAPPTVKDGISNSHRTLSFQRCSTNCQGRVSNSHRRLSFQRCSTNCQGQVLQFTPKTFAPALLHQLSRTGSPIHTEDFRSSAAPPTVKDRFSNSHRRLSLQRCSTNCQGQVLQFTPKTFAPALLHQLSRTGSPIHTENFRSSAAPPTVKDRFSNSHRRLSFQRCSTNCQGQVLQFTPKTFVPALLHQLSRTGSPKTFAPALHRRLSHRDFRPSAAPPTVKDRFSNSHRRLSLQRCSTNCQGQFSNSHRRLSLQRCSTNCQGQVLQFTPKTFVPALLHQLSRTGSPIHTEDFRSSAAPPTVKDRVLQFTPKTFDPALLHQLSKTGSPIHAEDFRSSAAPPTVKDRFSNSLRKLSLQLCSTNCQGQVFQFTPKTFDPALLHQLSRTGSPIHSEDFRSSVAPPTVKDRVLQFTPKTFDPALLHQLSRTMTMTITHSEKVVTRS